MARGDVSDVKLSFLKLCKRYGMNRNTSKGWLTIYDKGGQFHERSGCPTVLDNEAIDYVVNKLMKNKDLKPVKSAKKKIGKIQRAKSVKKPVNDPAMTASLLNKAYVDSQHARKRTIIRPTMDKKTMKATKKRMKIKTGKAGVVTTARLKAGQNPRSAYSMYIMLEAFSSRLDATNKWNSDATQLTCDSSNKGGMVCYVDTKEDSHEDQPLASRNFNGELSIAVKWMHFNNAAGEVAPIVLIFAVPSMPADTFFLEKVKGLRNTGHMESEGYIIFSKTRAGNSSLWQWFFAKYIIPIIKKAGKNKNIKVRKCNLSMNGSMLVQFSLELRWHPHAPLLFIRWRSNYSERII